MDNIKHICSQIIMNEQYAPQLGGVYIKTFKPGFSMNAHSHDTVEVISVIHGSAYMVIRDQLIKIRKNECLLIFPNVSHSFYLGSKESCCLVNVHFKPGIMPGIQNYGELQDSLRFLYEIKTNTMSFMRFVNNSIIRSVSERIIQESDNRGELSEVLIRIYFCELYIHLSKIMKEEYGIYTRPVNKHLSRAMEYIRNFYCDDISVSRISEYAGISARHLSRLFIDELRITVQEFVNTLKIKKAREMLEDTNQGITQIAYSLGFGSSQYFSTCFRRYVALSPLEYRRHVSKSNKTFDSTTEK